MGNVCWSKPLIFITLCMFLTCVKSHTTVRSHAGLNYQQCSDLCSTSQKCLQAISTRDGECYTTELCEFVEKFHDYMETRCPHVRSIESTTLDVCIQQACADGISVFNWEPTIYWCSHKRCETDDLLVGPYYDRPISVYVLA